MTDLITGVRAFEVIDANGQPTIEVEVTCGVGTFGAVVPSGSTVGIYEALEVRDDDVLRFQGKGCLKAVENVNGPIQQALLGQSVKDQRSIDKLLSNLDGSKNKSKLGANAILGTSIAVCRAGAACNDLPLYRYIAQLAGTKQLRMPVPLVCVLRGGKNTGGALYVQEYLIAAVDAPSFSEALRMSAEVYAKLRDIIKKAYGIDFINVGSDGAFAPPIKDPIEPFQMIREAIEAAGHGGKFKMCIDCAASELWVDEKKAYDLSQKNTRINLINGDALIQNYMEWVKRFPISSIEDPFDQDDWDHWVDFTSTMTKQYGVQVVADDLTASNTERISVALNKRACSAILLKMNQVGTITESIAVAKMALSVGWSIICSHRSVGETEDTFLADLAVGLGCGQIKSGAPCRSERIAKYNQLLRIEEELGQRDAPYGTAALTGRPLKQT